VQVVVRSSQITPANVYFGMQVGPVLPDQFHTITGNEVTGISLA
jgi:hypothetical protein